MGRSRISRELNKLSAPVTNPFEAADNETQVVDHENGWTADEKAAVEAPEVDVPETLEDETEDTVAPSASEGAAQETKPAKEKKNARVAPPEGLITPVQFAKELTKHLEAKGVSNKNGPVTVASAEQAGNPIPPQYIYSMLNQGNKPNAKNPIPTYVSAHDGTVYKTGEAPEGTPLARVNLLKLDEALAWWDAKDSRIAASKADKEAKEKAKAEKAAATPAATPEAAAPSEPVAEVE